MDPEPIMQCRSYDAQQRNRRTPRDAPGGGSRDENEHVVDNTCKVKDRYCSKTEREGVCV